MRPAIGLKLYRVSGAENTFFILNGFDSTQLEKFEGLSSAEKLKLIRWACSEVPGFKTDGFLVLKKSPPADFKWDFWNSDGSAAEMCGNAARCATLFFQREIDPKKEVRFETGAGQVAGQVLSPDLVQVEMTQIQDIQSQFRMSDGTQVFFANTGVPHVVLEKDVDLNQARRIRRDPNLGAGGANVTFVSDVQKSSAKAVTFERGVEDLTKACGTGAVAAALYVQEKYKLKTNVKIQMPGGQLEVDRADLGQRPLLKGPAQIEFILMV